MRDKPDPLSTGKPLGISRDTFGTVLKRHRIAAGYSQESLAERARLSAAAISTIERGSRRAPYRETIRALADALSLTDGERVEFFHEADRARARPTGGMTQEPPPASSVPTFLSSFVGREREITDISSALAEHRLATVTGSGGVGKTRVVCELLHRLCHRGERRIVFVELASVGAGALILGAIAGVLGVTLDPEDPTRTLLSHIREEALLLVLDNCEHLLHEVGALVRSILATSLATSILVTSRERLGLAGEMVYRLPSLQVPNHAVLSMDDAARFPALDLFIQRTHSLDRSYVFTIERLAMTTAICRRLDGIPLAIEFAAARVPLLGIPEVNRQLFAHFILRSGDPGLPLRQRTMMKVISWSYDLLDVVERTVARRLGVFAGSFSLRAAEVVCIDQTLDPAEIAAYLTRLLELSFLSRSGDHDETRYALSEPTRAFALARLAEFEEHDRIARRHARWLADYGEHVQRLWATGSRSETFPATHELDNIRAALEWCLASATDDDALLAGRIVGGFRFLWQFLVFEIEAVRWLNQTLQRIDAGQHPEIAGPLFKALIQNVPSRDLESAEKQATAFFERIGDWESLVQQNAYVVLAFVVKGQLERAETAARRAWELVEFAGLRETRAHVNLLTNEAYLLSRRGRFDRARGNLAEARALNLTHGYVENEAFHRYRVAVVEAEAGNVAGAVDSARAAIASLEAQPLTPDVIFMINGHRSFLAMSLLLIGNVAEAEAETRLHFENAAEFHGDAYYMGWLLQTLAAIKALQRRPVTAAYLHGHIDAWFQQSTNERDPLAKRVEELLLLSLREQLSESELGSLAAVGAVRSHIGTIREALSD